jgi:hypothetical protein
MSRLPYSKERNRMYQERYKSKDPDRYKRLRQANAERNYRNRHPDRLRQTYARYRAKHREERRLARAQERLDVMTVLGTKCARCGFDDPRALQFDHVNGGGLRHRRSVAGTTYTATIYALVRAGSPEIQLLCANCNTIKKVENCEIRNGRESVCNPRQLVPIKESTPRELPLFPSCPNGEVN